jgi:hypothetical protein
MAKSEFPSVRRLYVRTPIMVAQKGEMAVLDLDSPEAPKGAIRYEVVATGRKQKVTLAIGEQEAEIVLAPARLQTFKVSSRVEPWPQGVDPELVRARYGDEHEEKLALLRGPRGYNVRLARRPKKRRFQKNERVRICGLPEPEPNERAVPNAGAMQYQEGGTVVSSRKDDDGERFYEVLVDGSGDPQWFPAGAVCPIEREPSEG